MEVYYHLDFQWLGLKSLIPRVVKTNANPFFVGHIHGNLMTQPAFP